MTAHPSPGSCTNTSAGTLTCSVGRNVWHTNDRTFLFRRRVSSRVLEAATAEFLVKGGMFLNKLIQLLLRLFVCRISTYLGCKKVRIDEGTAKTTCFRRALSGSSGILSVEGVKCRISLVLLHIKIQQFLPCIDRRGRIRGVAIYHCQLFGMLSGFL